MDIQALKQELERVRERTHAIVAPVADDVLLGKHNELMGPMMWDLGHIAAFEDLWLVRVCGGYEPPAEEMGLAPLYNPFANPRALRGELALPGRQETFAEMQRVRRAAFSRLDKGDYIDSPLTRDGFLWRMIAQHEEWHQETMLVAANLRRDLNYSPAFSTDRPTADPVGEEMVMVPWGPFTMGTDDRLQAYDNERDAHVVDVPAFRIDAHPVTNARYRRYLEATGARPPLDWVAVGAEWFVHRFGRRTPLDDREPVMHVDWHEARAFAAWEGKRLPTEAEWEKAAAWDPKTGESRRFPWGSEPAGASRCNIDQHFMGPAPIGSFPAGASAVGCHQMLGDVWEWVESPFAPYPGFEAWPYEEFSTPFFGDNVSMRGGSWATGSGLIRNTLRNWDFPIRRQVFVGFRCAQDA